MLVAPFKTYDIAGVVFYLWVLESSASFCLTNMLIFGIFNVQRPLVTSILIRFRK